MVQILESIAYSQFPNIYIIIIIIIKSTIWTINTVDSRRAVLTLTTVTAAKSTKIN